MENGVAENTGVVYDDVDAAKAIERRLNDALSTRPFADRVATCDGLTVASADSFHWFIGSRNVLGHQRR